MYENINIIIIYKMNIKALAVIFIIILFLDGIVLTSLKPLWNTTVMKVQHHKLVFNMKYAFISYLLLVYGLYFFVYDNISRKNWINDSLLNGFMFGLIVYGVFDMTNLAIFKDYSLFTGLIDTLWGSILMSTTSFLTYYLLEIRK
jgi:uncharacterized membrane protein